MLFSQLKAQEYTLKGKGTLHSQKKSFLIKKNRGAKKECVQDLVLSRPICKFIRSN